MPQDARAGLASVARSANGCAGLGRLRAGVQREDRLFQRPRRQLRDLRDGRRRQRPVAADDRAADRHRSRLVARRQADRVHEQPRRQRRDLRHERRRRRPAAADDRPGDRQEPDLVAGRPRPRLPQRARRQRRDLRDERGRQRPAPADVERRSPTSIPPGRRTGAGSRSRAAGTATTRSTRWPSTAATRRG